MKLLVYTFGILLLLICNQVCSQCLDDDIVMLPPKSIDLFTGFGRDIELQDGYLITTANNSDSLAYESGYLIVYEFIDERWEKVADLTASIPTKGLQLGHYFRASPNIIAAKAYTYTNDGYKYEVIYIFEKDPSEKWTSRNESYILNPVPDIQEQYNGQVSLIFDIRNDILWVYHQYLYFFDFKSHYESQNRLFKLGKGSATRVESIAPFPNEDSTFYYHPGDINLNFGEDFMVVGLENYQVSGEYTSGKVMVYNYDDLEGWDHVPVELTRSYPRQISFGTSIDVQDNLIFVTNNRDDRNTEDNRGKVFIYEKQEDDKWSSSNEIAILSIPNISGSYNDRIVANEKYVIHSFPSEQKMSVFVKNEHWESKSEPDFRINFESELRGYGWELAISDEHFVYNTNDFAYSDNLVNGSELYSVTLDDDFESSFAEYDQVLSQLLLTSSGDEFSRNSSFYKSLGAVGTNLDNDKGFASGALNLYERNKEDLSWTRTGKLYSPASQAYQNFGLAVAINGKYLFASAPYQDSVDVNGDDVIRDLGKVYQFKRVGNEWEYFQQIITPDVQLANPDAAVKSPNQMSEPFNFNFRDIGFTDNISVDIEEKENGIEKLNLSSLNKFSDVRDFDTYRQFGKSIVCHNGYLAIGQRYFGGSDYKGRIYLFKEDSNGKWIHKATLQTSDQYHRDLIGEYPFVMNDSMIVAGSPYYSQNAFVFKRKDGEEWKSGTEDAILLPDRSELITTGRYAIEEFDSFGTSIDIYNNTIVVGAPYGERDDRLGSNSGRAYVYEMPNSGWKGEISYKHILKPNERILNGSFGYSVYIDQNSVLVGAPNSINRRRYADSFKTSGQEKRGRVYVFDRNAISESDIILNEAGQILPTGGHSFDLFGAKIEKNFLEIVVSAPLADTENGDRSGSAYMFKKVGAIEEDIAPLCEENGAIDLVAYPVTGGVWSGEGIIDPVKGIFDPAGLEENLYTISYQYGECTTSTNIAVYTKPTIVSSSSPVNYICIGGALELFAESNKENHDYRWYYKSTASEDYSHDYQWDNQKIISTKNEGYYYCVSQNPGCSSEPVFFEVKRVDEPTELNQEGTLNYCIGETHPLSLIASTQMDSYDWQYSSDTSISNFSSLASTANLQVKTSGLYFCQFEYLGCQFYSDTVNIQFDQARSSLNYTNQYELCMEETVALSLEVNSERMVEYEWYQDANKLGEYNLIANDKNLMISEGGNYFCRTYSSSGCTYISDTLKVNQEQISLIFDPIKPICNEVEIIALSVSPPGGKFTIINSNLPTFSNPQINPKMLENGEYEVLYEYEVQRCIYQVYQKLEIEIIDDVEIFVPNVFTPNGDGLNDTFHISKSGRKPSVFRFSIFNRSGVSILESDQFDFQWDGGNQASGVYFWSMSFGNDCDSRDFNGYLQILK